MQRAAMIGLGGILAIPALALAWFAQPQVPRPAPAAQERAAAVAPAGALPRPEPVVAPAGTGPAPRFDVVRVGATGSAVIAGRAAPGAEVVLLLDGREEIGRARADRRGEWVMMPPPIAPGAWELSLRARLGAEETPGTDAVVVMVPEPAGAAAPPAAAPPGAFAVLLPQAAPPRLLQAPAPREPAAAASGEAGPALAIGSVEQDQAGALKVAGSAPPGAMLRIQIGGRLLGDATADAEGHWAIAAPAGTGPGVVRVERIGRGGRVSARAEAPFAPPPAAEGRRVVVERGANLWRIARASYGEGPRYTVIYEANRAQIRDPGRIFPGQVLALPAGEATPAASSASR